MFDLMTKWIDRYRQEAGERYRRLDALLGRMTDNDPKQTHTKDAS